MDNENNVFTQTKAHHFKAPSFTSSTDLSGGKRERCPAFGDFCGGFSLAPYKHLIYLHLLKYCAINKIRAKNFLIMV